VPADPSWLTNGPATPQINAALRTQIEQLLGEYDKLKGNVSQLQQRLARAQGQAESKDGAIKLSVGPRGELRALQLDPRAYRRYSPSELAAQILELAGEATTDVQHQLDEVMTPFLPPGISYSQVADGKTDPASWKLSQPTLRDLLGGWKTADQERQE
jgi:DNA-binding protein YbaB